MEGRQSLPESTWRSRDDTIAAALGALLVSVLILATRCVVPLPSIEESRRPSNQRNAAGHSILAGWLLAAAEELWVTLKSGRKALPPLQRAVMQGRPCRLFEH